jgi:hypothetical protein
MKSKVNCLMDVLSEGRIVAVVEMLACDKPSTFWDGQTSILGLNVAVVNCRMGQNIARANCVDQIVA